MSSNTDISNCGISAGSKVICEGMTSSGEVVVSSGSITLGNASNNGNLAAFSGKDLFIGSSTTAYVSAPKVKIRGASSTELVSATNSRVQVAALLSIVSSATNYLKLSAMTETQRDALTAAAGMVVLNTSTGKLNFYTGSGWEAITSA